MAVLERDQVLDIIRSLGRSQGMYGRLAAALDGRPDLADELVRGMQSAGVEDTVGVILYIEGGL